MYNYCNNYVQKAYKDQNIAGLKEELSEAVIAELQGSCAEQHSKSQTVDNTPPLYNGDAFLFQVNLQSHKK